MNNIVQSVERQKKKKIRTDIEAEGKSVCNHVSMNTCTHASPMLLNVQPFKLNEISHPSRIISTQTAITLRKKFSKWLIVSLLCFNQLSNVSTSLHIVKLLEIIIHRELEKCIQLRHLCLSKIRLSMFIPTKKWRGNIV